LGGEASDQPVPSQVSASDDATPFGSLDWPVDMHAEAAVHDTDSRLAYGSPAGLGLASSVHVVPSHESASVTVVMPPSGE
jgi:hypothetical protein